MYRALNSYLTPNSEYLDAREAMVQSATDLYGKDSYEREQVQAAFIAGGVYQRIELSNLAVALIVVGSIGAGIAIYQIYFA